MNIIEKQLELSKTGKPYVMLTVAETDGNSAYELGKKMIVLSSGEIFGTVGGGALEAQLIRDAQVALVEGRGFYREFEHKPTYEEEGLGCHFTVSIFAEVFKPPHHVVVCGGGHVGCSVLQLAKFLGFETTLIDIRSPEELGERVKFADNFLHCTDYEKGVLEATVPEGAFYVCCASTQTQDKYAFRGILQRTFRYVGMLGGMSKAKEIKEQMKDEGFASELIERLYAPVGVDIANLEPEEIALSIMSEVLLVKNGKSLRHRKDPIDC